ncbi:MAG TPA: LysR family transcriptional regulator [Steroidobacteraceae bacterium]|jgi:molybdate transport system regulatory protein|nr:LysR family transcriptional regulator [Steroidobacteraceae bacterium]
MATVPTIRFRVDIGTRCSVGIGKIQLLETIAASGSLSQAARLLKMSYRRAWLLLEDMNASFKEPVASSSVGGRGGGGVALTDFGRRLIDDYRAVDTEIQALAARQFQHIVSHVDAGARVHPSPSASIKRRSAARRRRVRN